MREIKFRAWQEDAVEKDLRFWTWKEMLEHDLNAMVNNPKYKIMQYTGLKDENGTEIYEGDIVRHAADEGVYKVIFEDGGFYVKNLFEYDFQTINEYPLEVIGNIHENPGLLEVD